MATTQTLLTADDLLRMSADGKRCELIKGELIEMAPSGARHGNSSAAIAMVLGIHNKAHRLGKVFGAETGFRISHDPDTVRAPDAAFVSQSRLPPGSLPPGFLDLAPDLAVEVVSPSDTASHVHQKVEDWLEAGVRLVWVVYPNSGSVMVYRARDDVRMLSANDQLDGGQVLPGFTCPVRDLFEQ